MKKRFLITTLSLTCALGCVFGLAACGDTTQPHTHTLVKTEAKSSTCTANGNTEYWTCVSCNKYFSDEDGNTETALSATVILALEHDIIPHTAQAATCTEAGWNAYDTCARCDYTTYEEIPAQHDVVHHDAQAATCTEIGWEAYDTCSRCDYTTYEEISALGHKWNNNKCSVCGRDDGGTVGLYYSLIGETYEVLKGSATENIVIPALYNGIPVTRIANSAFSGCTNLTSISISEGITSIGYHAFYRCTNLINISIPESVASIGNESFFNCSSLTSVTIPDGVAFIGIGAFEGCSKLTSVTIPNGIASLESHMFYECSSLTDITIPNSVTSIGESTFMDCSSLTSMSIPDSVTSIGHLAFGRCSNLISINIPDSVTSIGSWAFWGCRNLQYNEYDNALYLGNENNLYYALISAKNYENASLNYEITSCTINNQARIIADGAFEGCGELTSITIPASVTSIGSSAFSYCINLMSITVNEGNKVYHSSSNCLIETASKKLVMGCENSIIPSDGSVTSIGNGAFSGCRSLTSITIPDNVTSIGNYAFWCCGSLTSITIPDSVTSIGATAFYECSSLTSITIPDSVTSIGTQAFNACNNLTDITFDGTKEQWNEIDKGNRWNFDTGNYTIHCTDGDIEKS